MKNVYDLRYEKDLLFILSEDTRQISGFSDLEVYRKSAVIIYLYYIDTLSVYYQYIDHIPQEIDLYVISSREDVLNEVHKHVAAESERNAYYIYKENRGRDVSALLIASRTIVAKYEYVCFLHDKKEHSEEWREDTQFWVENLWGNQIGTGAYIGNVLGLFESNCELGILTPPEPTGRHFDTWYGYGWYHSFEITQDVAQRLHLNADIRRNKPPVTFGTVLWFRSIALHKLFEAGWKYSDFDDNRLDDGNYLSYGIERIFAYVAQDAGYDTGTVMACSYAEKAMNQLQYITKDIFWEKDLFFPVNNLSDLECYKENKKRIIGFAKENRKVYLYGAGDMARLCAAVLRSENITTEAFIITGKSEKYIVDCIPVISAEEVDCFGDIAVIITVYDVGIQNEIENILKRYGCRTYIRMWDRSG